MDAAEMRSAIEEYGRTPTRLPEGWAADKYATIFPLDGLSPPTMAVDVPLETVEEGRSDLSLILTLTEVAPRTWRAVLKGIFVP